jgi:hypothetical protein
MALSDRLAGSRAPDARRDRIAPPKGFEPGVRYEPDGSVEVTVQLTEVPENEVAWREAITRVTGLDVPLEREVKLTQVRYWGREGEFSYCRFSISDRAVCSGLDVDGLVKAARAVKRTTPPKTAGTDKALVVAWADLQVGKVGSLGDSETLVSRVMDKIDSLEKHARTVKADTAYLVDVGDCIENFENTSSQMFTNDLSLPEQIRLARRLFTECAMRLAKTHSKVVVAGVPSNHGAWRRGKGSLGKPLDDFGIETLVAVADAFALNPAAFGHVSFVLPGEWEETLALDVNGTILSIAHGHQVNRPEGLALWWAKQVHGGQPAADADILLTGHFHHLRIQETGKSAHTGRSKWLIQAPTLDNGSDWYRHRSGETSEPALLTFVIDADGWSGLKRL